MSTSRQLLAHLRELHPKAIDLSLGRMRILLARLGNPQEKLPPVVHVAGTNGKGSVLTFLRAMAEADGRRVHCYFSPPLKRHHDAIRLATAPGVSGDIAEAMLQSVLQRVIDANGGDPLTSFEGETAAAFLAFAGTRADLLLLETGMGGLNDATNVVASPRVTILTPIAGDHVEFLGPTVADIAGHKAGILKRGAPCVVARQTAAVMAVIRKQAKALGVALHVCGEDWDVYEQHGRLVYQDELNGLLMDLPLPALAGRHQIENAGCAIAAARLLGDLAPGEAAIERGLTSAVWPARLQRLAATGLASLLPNGSELWVDGGHNAAAALSLAQAVAEMEDRASKRLDLVVGMLRSKDPRTFLEPFADLAEAVIAVPVPDVSRAYSRSYDTAEIVQAANALGIPALAAADLGAALVMAGELDDQPVRVLVCGSLHLAGHVLAEEEARLTMKAKGPSRG